ncbi:SLBB domain-containing protein [Geoalkalibacter halelectricus]|uniref:SLBB domain-containing protein n=1 Tax=Geoalkalibacter halelectricus TaxID=2847045 RepID=A0ABY5ZJJ7_9BACT|nr:SLBB domain-containing protein [Geoalkalibacter halelectricus]MDO3377866.1 SLBB domain-containing protein [Geoalkalibacter halelectricus]UWZ77950.1 SLBB domain-containing protein [Geoalkalibacter halelectricus]
MRTLAAFPRFSALTWTVFLLGFLLLAPAPGHAEVARAQDQRTQDQRIQEQRTLGPRDILTLPQQRDPARDALGVDGERKPLPRSEEERLLEQKKRLAVEKEAEPSPVERQFRQTPVPLGGAVERGESLRPAPLDPEALSKEEYQALLFLELATAPDTLPLREKVRLFRELDEQRRRVYLQTLAPEERRRFLDATGERESPWYVQDLRAPSVDRDLRQFGFRFFETADPAFLPDHLAPVGPDYPLGPGDILIIHLWGSIDGRYELTIDRSGVITIPRVGTVSLWGQTLEQGRDSIRQAISKYFSNFEMNVTLGALRSIQVFLVGEVENPGTYTVSSMATILNALTLAGGPTRNGSLRNVQLVRAGATVAEVDFYAFFTAGDRSRDLRLQAGDTIHVPMAGAQVGIAGDVRRPAIYELKGGETLGDLLRLAGGFQSTAYLRKVQVERVLAHQARKVIDLDLGTDPEQARAGMEFALSDRDMVQVYSIAPVKNRYVMLKGYVARPGPYELFEGMRLSDLLLRFDNLLPYYYPGFAEVLRLQPPLFQPRKLTVDLAAALAGDLEEDLLLQEHDEITLFSREDMEERAQVRISGAVQSPGLFRYFDEMRVRDLVVAAGNVRRGTYRDEAEITRFERDARGSRTRQILINLEKALAGDPAHNIVLHPDDQLFVRTLPDFSEMATVRLEGEVRFPGEYTVGKGETLASLLARAGGFTERAYLRGAMFTRESVRQLQQERLEQLIREQEQAALRVSSEIAGGAMSRDDIQSAQALLDARQELLRKLRETPVTGRMVVRLAPLDDFRGSSYDIELFDGDTLSVPTNPRTVMVLGQVYNPITITFSPGKTVSHYLNQVGGTREDANTREMFIVRADGTVLSQNQAGAGVSWDRENFRWVFGGFNNTVMYPGDTLLVPEKFRRIHLMREIKDLTQIFYQIALGAAAVASF